MQSLVREHWALDFKGISSNVPDNVNEEEINFRIVSSEVKRYSYSYFSDEAISGKIELKNSKHSSIERSFQLPKFKFGFHRKARSNYFRVTQKWIGHVDSIDVNGRIFTAVLQDLTNGGTNEIVELDFDEVSMEDLSLIQSGAAFYWSIGYATSNGQIKKESIIRFQRFPDWTEDEYNAAADWADSMSSYLD